MTGWENVPKGTRVQYSPEGLRVLKKTQRYGTLVGWSKRKHPTIVWDGGSPLSKNVFHPDFVEIATHGERAADEQNAGDEPKGGMPFGGQSL